MQQMANLTFEDMKKMSIQPTTQVMQKRRKPSETVNQSANKSFNQISNTSNFF